MFALGRISEVVSEFKHNWTDCLKGANLEELCREVGLSWRNRILTPPKTLELFFLQILHGNTACSHLTHLSDLSFSATAYCQARMRLPLKVLEELVRRIGDKLQRENFNEGLWRGHRVWLVDGSSCSMPDTEQLQQHFGQHGKQAKGCGFPIAHLLGLVHAKTGMVQKLIVSPFRTHDMKRVVELHSEMRKNDIVVKDRGFCSYPNLSLLLQGEVHAVIRMHQRKKVTFKTKPTQTKANKKQASGKLTTRWLKKLGIKDQLVEWYKPIQPPLWMNKEQFALLSETMVVRELCYQLNKPGFRTKKVTLVTTLIDAQKYPKEAIAQLYGLRWEIETNFGHLKTTMGMDVLRCKTLDGVLKEILVFCLVYNLVRLVILEASKQQGIPPNRISFIDALRWIQVALPKQKLPPLMVIPIRKNRFEPRVRKRRPKTFLLMNKPREQLKKIRLNQSLAA